MTAPETTCAVCGEAVDESNSAVCGGCDRRYHLNLRNDVEGKDCGEVWVDELYLSLRFACFACLRRDADTHGGRPSGPGAAGEDDTAEPPVAEGH